MEGARTHKEHVARRDQPVARAHARAFEQREQLLLHALALLDVPPAAAARLLHRELIDLVHEDDPALLHLENRAASPFGTA